MAAIALSDRQYNNGWVCVATSSFWFNFKGCGGALVALAEKVYAQTFSYEVSLGFENTHTILRR